MSSSSGSSSGSSDNEASGRVRMASGSSSRSRSRSVSSASSKSNSPAHSRRSSSSGSSSPKFVSATSSDNSLSKKSDASSTTSSKGRRRMKAKDRKVSNKMAEKLRKSDESEDEQVSSEEDRRKPRGRPVRAPGVKKASPVKGRRGTKKETSSEEGEIASDDKEFDDGLDDDLIGDDEDRERLEKMTEREREEELFKRAENRENLKKRFEIKKKLKQQQKHKEEKKQVSDESEEGQRSDSSDDDTQKSPKRHGSSSPSDSDGGNNRDVGYGTIHDAKERSQDRRKNLDALKKYSALSELKAKRQERERRDQERAQKRELNKSRDDDSDDERSGDRRKKRRSRSRSSSSLSPPAHRRAQRTSSSSSASSRSRSRSSSASDTERFKKSSSKQIQKYVEIMGDLEPIRLSRSKLEKFVHLPFFKKLVLGCFVRIGIGACNSRSVYRLAEVCDVLETAKVYNLGTAKTNIGLRLRFGRNERVFRLEFASNSQTTQQEFEKWKSTCLESQMQLPTLEFVKVKSNEIKEAINYEFTSEDIDKIVAQKERFHKHPVNYAMHKARLMKERDAALTNGDEARAQEFEVKLGELEERAEELDKKRTATISSVSLINDRNRKANVSKAEVAIMREIAHKKLHGQESNPFVRRPCNPRIVTKKEIEDDSAQLQVPQEVAPLKPLTDEILKRKMDQGTEEDIASKKSKLNSDGGLKHDLFEAHNFDIEIDVDTSFISPAASKPVLQPAVVPPKNTVLGGGGVKPSKRSLNLDDYKKKRGLI